MPQGLRRRTGRAWRRCTGHMRSAHRGATHCCAGQLSNRPTAVQRAELCRFKYRAPSELPLSKHLVHAANSQHSGRQIRPRRSPWPSMLGRKHMRGSSTWPGKRPGSAGLPLVRRSATWRMSTMATSHSWCASCRGRGEGTASKGLQGTQQKGTQQRGQDGSEPSLSPASWYPRSGQFPQEHRQFPQSNGASRGFPPACVARPRRRRRT